MSLELLIAFAATAIFSILSLVLLILYLREKEANREVKKRKSWITRKEKQIREEWAILQVEKSRLRMKQNELRKKSREIKEREFKLWIRSSLFLVYPLVQALYSWRTRGSVPVEIILGIAITFFIFLFGGFFASKFLGFAGKGSRAVG